MSNTPLNFNQASVRANELVANERLGIGTHTQTATIHAKAAAAEMVLEDGVTNGQATETAFRLLTDGGTTHFQCGTSTSTGSAGDLAFQNYGGTNTFMILKSSGRLGIGTTSPDMGLHVHANVGNSGIIISSTSGYHRLYDNGQLYIQSGTAASADSRADINFTSMYASTSYMKILASNGNVGIGTTIPIVKLHVNGTLKTNNPAFMLYYAAGVSGRSFGSDAGADVDVDYLAPTPLWTDADIEYNIGSHLELKIIASGDTLKYPKFTAPVSGLYQFSINIGTENRSGAADYIAFGLEVNNESESSAGSPAPDYYFDVVHDYLYTSGNFYTSTGTLTLQLEEDDFVVLYCRSVAHSRVSNGFAACFSGRLVQ